MRKILSGTAAARGSALGRARVQLPHALDVEETRIAHEEVDAELQRIHDAVVTVREEMRLLRERLHGALAHEVGEFLDLHALLLDDPELLQGIDALIRTGRYSADYALRLQRDRIAAVFDGIDDPYLRSRIDDIDQVIGRLYAALNRRKADLQGVAGEILVTDNIGPADLAQLHAQGVIGVVTAASSALSHSAILARSLHMPLVVGASAVLQKVNDGDVLIIDGGTGLVVLEPNAADLRDHHARTTNARREQRQLNRLRREPSRTLDGVDIKLWANAESREDVAEAHALGSAGVGLYRTEYLFINSSTVPDEDTQFRAYRDLVLGMTGRTVTIRTLDVGADKADNSGLALRNEPNPALGLRGVRLSLARRGLMHNYAQSSAPRVTARSGSWCR
jgi:phosphotransferase system enzyme I (PtsI)